MNADEHKGILKKLGRDASESRPDICHQVSILVINLFLVFTDSPGLSSEQGWIA